MVKSRVTCCIRGCTHRPGSTTSDNEKISFYSFPSASPFTPWKLAKRNSWINSVKKFTFSPKAFKPTKSTVICSAHFVGNEKSEHPLHPSYLPTIFPGKRIIKDCHQSIARFERQKKRERRNKFVSLCNSTDDRMDITQDCLPSTINNPMMEVPADLEFQKKMQTVSCQTDFRADFDTDNVIYLFCATMERNGVCDAAVETNIIMKKTEEKGVSVDLPMEKKKMKDAECDPLESDTNLLECSGFHGMKSIKSDKNMSTLTGITLAAFFYILNLLPKDLNGSQLSVQTKLLITLMKLKTGLRYSALAIIFNAHETTIKRTFIDVLECLSVIMKNFIYWPSKESVKMTLPEAFKRNYPDARVIIDCTEIKTEVPPTVKNQVLMYPRYKQSHTVKFLIGCTPSGFVSFLSDCYGDRAGDCYITNDSGILDLLESGDVVLADRGFPHIRTDVENKNAILVMPPFAHGDQFSVEEVEETYNIASVRIHIERIIQRIRDNYIFYLLPNHLLSYVDKIVFVVCALINLENPIIQEDRCNND